MAGIGGFKPLTPVWPVTPGRKVEYDDEPGQRPGRDHGEAGDEAPPRKRPEEGEKRGDEGPGDEPPHIDEYA